MYKYNSKDVLNMFRGGSLIYNAEQEVCTRLFSGNTPGFWYDPNDLSTMFQDTTGTITVTAAGQPVGLILDKSKPITNTSILDSTFLLADGWLKSNPAISVTNVGGSLRVSKGAISPNYVYKSFSCESNKLYRLSVKYKNHTGNNVRFFIRNANGTGVAPALSQTIQTGTSTDGEGSTFFISNSDTHAATIDSQNVADSSIDITSIVITKVSDSINHAYQTTSALRPILRQTPILGSELVVNDTFNTGVTNWSTGNGSAITKVTNGGMLITATTAANSQAAQNMGIAAGKTVQASVTFKNKVGNTQPKIALWSSSTGDVGGAIASSTTVSGTLTFLAQVPVGFAGQVIVQTNNANIGDNIEISSVSVKEVVGYYADCNYLEFDGIDDFLQTNLIDLTATDKISLFTGVRKLSDSATRVVFELSADLNNNNGGFYLTAPSSANSTNYSFSSKGTVSTYATVTGYTSPTTNVLCARSDISGDRLTVRIDGVEKFVSTTDQGSGNFGNYPLFIGRRGGLYIPFSGYLYNLIGVGNLVSDADTILLEKLMALKTGVTLNA